MGGRVNTRADRCFYTKRRRAERDPSRGQRLACPSTCTPVFNPPLFDCLALCTDGQVMTRCDDVWKRTVARATNCLLPLSLHYLYVVVDAITILDSSISSTSSVRSTSPSLSALCFVALPPAPREPNSPRGVNDDGTSKLTTK